MKVNRQSKWIGLKSRFSGLAVSLLFIYTKYLMLLLSPQCEVNTGHCSDVISLECLLKLSGVKGKTKQRNRKKPSAFSFFSFFCCCWCAHLYITPSFQREFDFTYSLLWSVVSFYPHTLVNVFILNPIQLMLNHWVI